MKPEQQTTYLVVSSHAGHLQYWNDVRWVDEIDQAKIYVAADCCLTDWSRLQKYKAEVMQVTITKAIIRGAR